MRSTQLLVEIYNNNKHFPYLPQPGQIWPAVSVELTLKHPYYCSNIANIILQLIPKTLLGRVGQIWLYVCVLSWYMLVHFVLYCE